MPGVESSGVKNAWGVCMYVLHRWWGAGDYFFINRKITTNTQRIFFGIYERNRARTSPRTVRPIVIAMLTSCAWPIVSSRNPTAVPRLTTYVSRLCVCFCQMLSMRLLHPLGMYVATHGDLYCVILVQIVHIR